ncbi:insulinase family protein [Hyalangium rubrum]|uniref:Insulinase family protein n=1 Tax=Hyalangium rubrum TaxID=3103134 RepID=A0ABU5HD93_9BACT|nr:insulinase family protein [Hyalangium sp. s54d21]MDY7231226.1 insulinase family protein [Hyalangium sp. s54d21]
MRRLLMALCTLALTACATTPEPAPQPEQATPVTAPQPEAAKPEDPEAFRAKMPQPAKPPDLVLPTFEEARLDNGLTVLVSTRRQLPLVYVGMAFAAGSAQDPAGLAGASDIAYKMLLEGAGGKDTIALDNAFADLGVSPSVSVNPDGAFVGVRVLTRNVEPALALLSDVVRKPTFAPKDFERRKKQQLADLVRRMGSPSFLAQQAYLTAVFGEKHPYAHPVGGVPSTVEKVSLQDVKRFYQQQVGPKAAALVVTGDVTKEQALAWAQKHFGDWKGAAALPPVPPAPPVPPRELVRLVAKPGLEQTFVMVGRPGIAIGHSDEYALELATTVFGGFFGSRLNMNLREAKGYTYGAGAGSDARLGVGPLTVYSAVRANVTGPAVTEFMRELTDIKARPITSQELEAAREGLIRAYPGSFETVSGLGASAAALFFKRRPMDEFARTVAGLEKATPAEVQRVAEAYLNPAVMQIILVGDPELVRTQVGPLNLGRLTPVEVAGAGAPAAAGKK